MNTTALPRQTYMKPEDAAREQRLAELFAQQRHMGQLKIGVDDPDKMKPRIDRLLHSDGIVRCFFEAKGCPGYDFRAFPTDGWVTGKRKTAELRNLYNIVRVPVLYLVEFQCGTVAFVDVMKEYVEMPGFGRSDRGDLADAEGGTQYQWGDFRVIKAA